MWSSCSLLARNPRNKKNSRKAKSSGWGKPGRNKLRRRPQWRCPLWGSPGAARQTRSSWKYCRLYCNDIFESFCCFIFWPQINHSYVVHARDDEEQAWSRKSLMLRVDENLFDVYLYSRCLAPTRSNRSSPFDSPKTEYDSPLVLLAMKNWGDQYQWESWQWQRAHNGGKKNMKKGSKVRPGPSWQWQRVRGGRCRWWKLSRWPWTQRN